MKEKIQQLKKEHIIEIASRHFTENGYEETKMNIVAKEAGVSIGTIYDFFDNKEGVFKASIFSIIDESIDTFIKLIEDVEDPKEKLIIDVQHKFNMMVQYEDTATEILQATPWFFSKLMMTDPFRRLEEVLGEIFKELNEKQPLRNTNYIQVARCFIYYTEAYTTGSMLDKTAMTANPKDVVEEFLQGMIQ